MASKRERGRELTGANCAKDQLVCKLQIIMKHCYYFKWLSLYLLLCSLHNAFDISYMTLKPKANCYVLGIVCITKECQLFWEAHVSENNILLY